MTHLFKKIIFFVVFLQILSSSFLKCNNPDLSFEELLFGNDIEISIERQTRTVPKEKKWTFLVYIAADNDLRVFVANNIKQMATIGTNESLNVVIYLDIRLNSNQKVTRLYLVEKGKITLLSPSFTLYDSGNAKTLVAFASYATENFPAQDYALILWNHGTGIIDPDTKKTINPADLFLFNPSTNKFDLDRSQGFLDLLCTDEANNYRGICWDSTTGNYLTHAKLNEALNEIHVHALHGKKLSIIGFDACLMSMVEVASLVRKYGHIMISSQEVELGSGWDYSKVLSPFIDNKTIDKIAFASHIVDVYKKTYQTLTNDFTQSALNLDRINELEANINQVASLLGESLLHQKGNFVRNAIRASHNKQLCTHFDEPTYLDLHHFYTNLLTNLPHFAFQSPDYNRLKDMIYHFVTKGLSLIEEITIANVCGKNLAKARGISIYFPERKIHSSYYNTFFAQTNEWTTFLQQYINGRQG